MQTEGNVRVTPTSDMKKQKIELDPDAVIILNDIRKQIKGDGISGVTYSDVVRWLAVKCNIREGRM